MAVVEISKLGNEFPAGYSNGFQEFEEWPDVVEFEPLEISI